MNLKIFPSWKDFSQSAVWDGAFSSRGKTPQSISKKEQELFFKLSLETFSKIFFDESNVADALSTDMSLQRLFLRRETAAVFISVTEMAFVVPHWLIDWIKTINFVQKFILQKRLPRKNSLLSMCVPQISPQFHHVELSWLYCRVSNLKEFYFHPLIFYEIRDHNYQHGLRMRAMAANNLPTWLSLGSF